MELRKAEDELCFLEETYNGLCKKELSVDIGDLKPLNPITSSLDDTHTQNNNFPEESTNQMISRISAEDFLNSLIEVRDRLNQVESIVEKLRLRLTMKDPVTNAPRYGKKTIERVEIILAKYNGLKTRIDDAFGEDVDNNMSKSQVQVLETYIQQENKVKDHEKQVDEARNIALSLNLKREEEELVNEKKRIEEENKIRQRKERENLRIRAEEARARRVENEQRMLEQEREADRLFLSSIEVGSNGVRLQLQVLRENCNTEEFKASLNALRTIYAQISSRPEEIQFRRIRRDHPKFEEDIGRHKGGKELLIAGGFTFKEMDGIKCFFSAEPDLATDMDAWSAWYQLIKDTLNILDEEMSN